MDGCPQSERWSPQGHPELPGVGVGCGGRGGRRQSSESPIDQSQLARGLLPARKGSGGKCQREGPQGSVQVEGPEGSPTWVPWWGHWELALIVANTDISGRPASVWLCQEDCIRFGNVSLGQDAGTFL